MQRPPSPGKARFVVNAQSVLEALQLLQNYLQQAGGQSISAGQASEGQSRGWAPSRQGTARGSILQPPPDPSELTDIDQVIQEVADEDEPIIIDGEVLYEELSKQVRGQDEALKTLSSRVARHIARRSPRRPATFFLIGPTGVGKTTAAQSLVTALKRVHPLAAGYSFLGWDMSEYQESYRLSQLLGSPQGYIGYGEGSQFTDALIANPKLVVVFDEIEKAHRSILKALMNAMDAGRLSTAAKNEADREIDCRLAIFIFASNHESQSILAQLTERGAFDAPEVVNDSCRHQLVRSGVAPELVGRIGSFLVFQLLTKQTRAEIATLSIVRVAEEYGLRVCNIEPRSSAESALSQSTSFGARPVEYSTEDLLGDAFAHASAKQMRAGCIEVGPPIHWVPLADTFPMVGAA
jgi:ATP-dependent Clp protease ATP-binding subunit ClpB